jgi:8-oxo-dGTP pyrophosphatase MutT (NUDIX family)
VREQSAGAVIFRRHEGKMLYLLLHYRYKNDYWDFPRGNINKGEKVTETVAREIREETGIEKIKILDGFDETVNYFYRREGENVFKEVIYKIAETEEEQVKISDEHIGYEWLDFDGALARLNFDNSKNILQKTNDFLHNQGKQSLKSF